MYIGTVDGISGFGELISERRIAYVAFTASVKYPDIGEVVGLRLVRYFERSDGPLYCGMMCG